MQCDPTTSLSAVALEMEQLFVKQSSLEVYFEWLDSVIERRVSEVSLYELMKGKIWSTGQRYLTTKLT